MLTTKCVRFLNSTIKLGAVSKMISNQTHLSQIFHQAVIAVRPENLLLNTVRVDKNQLIVNGRSCEISKHVYVIGFGKAVLGMAVQLEKILGTALTSGIATVPDGIFEQFASLPEFLPSASSRIRFIEGAKDNLPDLAAYNGAVKIRNLVTTIDEGNILIVLISGGGSSLLPLPRHPITLEEKLALIKSLGKAGATIIEINTVRKKLSELKGGRLALLGRRTNIISLILSDVVGDPLDFIASGPTVRNVDESDAALRIVQKYHLLEFVSDSVREVLTSKEATSSVPTSQFDWVHNVIIGNNKLASQAAAEHARNLGYQAVILTVSISSDVKTLSVWYAHLVKSILSKSESDLRSSFEEARRTEYADLVDVERVLNFDLRRPICLIGSGEPTVVVRGNGKGGRNQELALRFSLELSRLKVSKHVTFLAAGTDGIDGPTDAAGAFGSANLVDEAKLERLDTAAFIKNSDSNGFYSRLKQGQYLMKIGHTGTNVMDLHLITIGSPTSN